jgi:hypothetical protein
MDPGHIGDEAGMEGIFSGILGKTWEHIDFIKYPTSP